VPTLLRLEVMTPLQIAESVADVLIVAYLVLRVLLLIRGTRAVQLVKGITLLLIATPIASLIGLNTTGWLLGKAEIGLAIALPIVFQPELRRALEQLGEGRFFGGQALGQALTLLPATEMKSTLEEVARAARTLSATKTGALMAIERTSGLTEYAETGTPLDARVSSELLLNVFAKNTPLHDGAVIIRGERVVAAGAFLPLGTQRRLPPELGTRHRAAVALSEQSDAVVVVVSEETGTISVAQGGRLIRHVEDERLESLLASFFPQGQSLMGSILSRGGRREPSV
jgi:diadenylate cyclase